MKQVLQLKYGIRQIPFSFSELADIFKVREPECKVSEELFLNNLREVIGRPAGLDFKRPCVVVADQTRLCEYAGYLPALLQALEQAGADSNQITIYIAYGTHPRQSDQESLAVYGSSYSRCRFVHHNCSDQKSFVSLGRTSRGTPVLLRRDIVESTCLITFGAISHHYFAGYGGGRKLVFPGLGFRDAIYRNHGLFLDMTRRTLSPECRPGKLDGNPLAEDLAEYEAFRPADLTVHGILNSRGRVCELLPGRGAAHFRMACAIHGRYCEIDKAPRYDVVFASCGGYPKDINFIQSHKAIHNAAQFVRDGGTLIILAECRDGIGSGTFLPWFTMGGRQAAFDRLAEDYQGNGGTALAMMAKLERIQILAATELDDSLAMAIGFRRITLQEARNMARDFGSSLAVIPNASLLVRTD